MKVPYLINPNTAVTVMLPGKILTARADHPKFKDILDRLTGTDEDVSTLERLFDLIKPVADYLNLNGALKVSHGAVSYNGSPISNYTTDKIFQFMELGLPSQPIINFLGRVLQNPSKRAVTELYSFLEHKNMPLTSEGFFRAYKGVKANYHDKYTGKFNNSVGQILSMPRFECDDDARNACSTGFHAGSLTYASDWAGPEGHLMVVEIDPADVVAVPYDCSCQKLRTWRYKVVDELKDRLPMVDTYINTENEGTPEDSGEDDFEDEYCAECGGHIESGHCDCY